MLIEEMNNTRAKQLIGKIDTLLLPVGTLEAHGPHCSVASDMLIPVRLCQEVEKLASEKVFIGPVIPYGHTWHLKEFAGSHDVPNDALCEYVFGVLHGFVEWKIKYAIILNGHGGNTNALNRAAEHASDIGIKTIVLSWWGSGFPERFKGVVNDIGGHGGESETSLLWFVGDKYVDPKLIPKQPNPVDFDRGKTVAGFGDVHDRDSTRKVWGPSPYTGNPGSATKEKGAQLNEIIARSLVEVIDAFHTGNLV
jgi:creatinine amidohydrolase